MAGVCEACGASDEDQQLGLISNNKRSKKPWWLRNLYCSRRWVDVVRQKVLGSGWKRSCPHLWWARSPSPEQEQQQQRRRRWRWRLHIPKVRFRLGVGGHGKVVVPSRPDVVPKGFLPVYVGQQHQRFVIPIFYLTHPLFESLLDQAAQEYEFQHQGALLIPCEVPAFELLSACIAGSKGFDSNPTMPTQLGGQPCPPSHST